MSLRSITSNQKGLTRSAVSPHPSLSLSLSCVFTYTSLHSSVCVCGGGVRAFMLLDKNIQTCALTLFSGLMRFLLRFELVKRIVCLIRERRRLQHLELPPPSFFLLTSHTRRPSWRKSPLPHHAHMHAHTQICFHTATRSHTLNHTLMFTPTSSHLLTDFTHSRADPFLHKCTTIHSLICPRCSHAPSHMYSNTLT